MLWNASKIEGYAILASDGEIGTIKDFLIDDTNWLVRWLVVDTGHWLSGRKVLLPSSAMVDIDSENGRCLMNLTMQQIKDSPDVDTERSVTRQMESHVYGYYGYSPYWTSGYGYMNGIGYPGVYGYMGGIGGARPLSAESRVEEEIRDAQKEHFDVHLRSVAAVTGYHIHASDGKIGHVEDFLIEDADWSIRYLVVDTKNWLPGKRVLISPRSVKDIDWSGRLVNIVVDRQKVGGAPAYDASATVDQAYEDNYLAYYDIELADA